ncbi:hypothetical protein B1A99_03115 [Cohnella sp. CIP 111063]|uniref:glycosyltransferase family 8 protein n=1 Tax=unclassified Cohnella TaxID=2636738 RepID=UPI000B8BF7B5|nr:MULTISPECIES: glycosyltransferase family 8 protein [unclassified Cohnella]OXS61621.1 hypothetical protein B1A99_03115 [Cohnella sp. CIP 111063]PRX74039.1 lipopolysaccharide biosynthesis glycosyltransferase [Cohnella sp. SGD-V74]
MPNKQIIPIVAATDEGYAQHLAVAMKSLAANLATAGANFYVLHNGLSARAKEKLERSLDGERASIRFIPVDLGTFGSLPTNHHINEISYCKIIVPELLESLQLRKAIYIDCDIVVKRDLLPLWNLDLQGHALAAVRDIGGDCRKEELGIPVDSAYFNAGILVFDVHRWTEDRLSRKVWSMVARHPEKLMFHDQDALNAVLHDDWLELPACWNFQSNMILAGLEPADPCIVHYTGASKPWHYANHHPYADDYFKYLAQTSWASFRPERTLRMTVKQIVKTALPASTLRLLSRLKRTATS